ncbi:MAG: serine/threonine-protein kinase [Candidatus Eremiobacteraeota bacterium]|nr:serine/threonine-protein kinase [Candidatus Eremiobacteraeota bacterium]
MMNIDRKVWVLQGYYQMVKILEELDYSTVYLARDVEKGTEEFAIKEVMLHHESEESLKKGLKHFEKIMFNYMDIFYPYLANILDFFYEDGYEYIVMRFVPGRRLQEIIDVRNEPFSAADVTDIGIMIASALHYLHSKQPPIFFADLFPSNIIITPKGGLELTDYGLGKILARRPPGMPLRGTKAYAPPEQYGSRAVVNAATDVYAMGVVLHQLASGHRPSEFEGRLPPVRELNPAVDERLDQIITQATEPSRSARTASAKQVLRELSALKGGSPLEEETPTGKSQMKLWLSRILSRRKFEM